ncbi:MAG: hypothetical protein HY904_00765 [Deltaproteobacteria bacterium]|nr:hypothetical protein [Deltaproteobacteria bacterium]
MRRNSNVVIRLKNNLALASGLAGLVFGVAAYARTPTSDAAVRSATLPYQGFLERDGAPVNTPTALAFELYDSPSGGTLVWGPEVHSAVPVSAGSFSVNLGELGDMQDVALAGSRWLQVTVDGQPLGGRQLLGSAPYARRGAPGQDFRVDGDATVAGNVNTSAAAIANKWRLADTGDTWLRLYDATGAGYYGGVAANDLYANASVNTGDLVARGDISASANSHGACVDVPVSVPGVNFSDNLDGHVFTGCANGQYVAGVWTKHYQEGGNFRDRYTTYIRCCLL